MSLNMKGWIHRINPTQKEIEIKGGEIRESHDNWLVNIGCKPAFITDEYTNEKGGIVFTKPRLIEGVGGINPSYWEREIKEANKDLEKSFIEFITEEADFMVQDHDGSFFDEYEALEFYTKPLDEKYREYRAYHEAKKQKAEEVLKLYTFIKNSKFIKFGTRGCNGAFSFDE